MTGSTGSWNKRSASVVPKLQDTCFYIKNSIYLFLYKKLNMKTNVIIVLLSLFSLSLAVSCTKEGIEGFEVFRMSEKDNVSQVPADLIIDEVSAVTLEASSEAPILGQITSLYESGNSYLIISERTVYEYGKDGHFVRRIGAKGRGPGEYLNPRGIGVSGGRLYVFDYNTQNILTYGEDGSFIGSSSHPELMNSGIYLTSFCLSGDDIIFYSSTNSSLQDLFRYDAGNDVLNVLSAKNREMLPDEIILGENIIFGQRSNPYVYNNFNDTVYVLGNDRLIPSFLMRLGKYRYKYSDLTIEKVLSLSESRLHFWWIAAAGENIFISYSVTIGEESPSYLGLYNTRTGEYSQNVEITGIPEDFAAITSSERLFEGMQDDELLSVRPVSDTGDEYVIIKYRFK